MRHILLLPVSLVMLLLLVPVPGAAKDYVVNLLDENYKEEPTSTEHAPQIYHTLQIDSEAGRKLLILKGTDYRYRIWLREYMADNSRFIVRVPDEESADFASSKAFEIDVSRIHPVSEKAWQFSASKQAVREVAGSGNILVVDTNADRRELLRQIINQMGYPAEVMENGRSALQLFRAQPERFSMVITDYHIQGMSGDAFVQEIVKISPRTPVIIGSGYNNPELSSKLAGRFSGVGRVMVKPVLLKDLSRIINQILNQKV